MPLPEEPRWCLLPRRFFHNPTGTQLESCQEVAILSGGGSTKPRAIGGCGLAISCRLPATTPGQKNGTSCQH